MAWQYPFNVDVTTHTGQDEILSLWSTAELAIGQAAWIMKMTHEEFIALAKERGVSPPSEELVASKYAELDARMKPLARTGVRRQARELVSEAFEQTRRGHGYLTFLHRKAQDANLRIASIFYAAAQTEVDRAIKALAIAMTHIDDAKRAEAEANDGYAETSARVLEGLDPVVKRPDYYLIGIGDGPVFDYVNPTSVHDILWSWSAGFLTAEAAQGMLGIEPNDSLDQHARNHGIPIPTEEALTPEHAALILGDEPVKGDLTFQVRRRIKSGRLNSLRRNDVEARRLFEERQNTLLAEIATTSGADE